MKVPSRAELGHFNFRAENELDFFLIYSFFSSIFFSLSHFKKKQYYLQQNRVKMILFLLKMTNFWGEKRKLEQKSYISNFRAEKKVRAEGKRSRAEPKILQLELWLEPARLGLITTIQTWMNAGNPYPHSIWCRKVPLMYQPIVRGHKSPLTQYVTSGLDKGMLCHEC